MKTRQNQNPGNTIFAKEALVLGVSGRIGDNTKQALDDLTRKCNTEVILAKIAGHVGEILRYTFDGVKPDLKIVLLPTARSKFIKCRSIY